MPTPAAHLRRTRTPTLLLAALVVGAIWSAGAAAATGSFSASDPLLTTVWAQSAKTAGMMLSAPVDLGPDCSYPAGHTIILDGYDRDRCAWVGDLAVTGKTLLLSGQGDPGDLRFELQAFADTQRPDGSICPVLGPMCDDVTLVDYGAYWIEALRDYVLYTGDVSAAQSMLGAVDRLLDGYYLQASPDGLFENTNTRADYGFLDRRSETVCYYNALIVVALRDGAQLARWAGSGSQAVQWESRAASLSRAVLNTFWDSNAGVFKDTPNGPLVHAQDDTAFAVLASVGTPAQRRSALDYLASHNAYNYGNSISDTDAWDGYPWGDGSQRRSYPFMSFFEVEARFQEQLDASAIDLIRREWGYMAENGTGTTWEVIGPFGSPNVFARPSLAHGWSTGAVPALTSYVLGVQPKSPGFESFVAEPHTGDLQWAAGDVPTPRGTIHFEWRRRGAQLVAKVVSPVPGSVVLPAVGPATVNGRTIAAVRTVSATTVRVGAGTSAITVGAAKPKTKPVRSAVRSAARPRSIR